MRSVWALVAVTIIIINRHNVTRFPWESAYTGRDVTQPCCPEVANNQQHITADIGMAVENYFRATGDMNWMREEGCELIQEIALFAASRVEYDQVKDRYEITGGIVRSILIL